MQFCLITNFALQFIIYPIIKKLTPTHTQRRPGRSDSVSDSKWNKIYISKYSKMATPTHSKLSYTPTRKCNVSSIKYNYLYIVLVDATYRAEPALLPVRFINLFEPSLLRGVRFRESLLA